METKIFFAALLIVCLSQLPVSKANVRIFEKSISQDEHEEYFSTEDGRITYVKCTDVKSEKHCKIVQLTVPYENISYSCEVALKKDDNYKNIAFHTFGEGKFIIFQSLRHEVIIYTVHLAECRLSQGLRIPESKKPDNAGNIGYQLRYHYLTTTYKDTFDIFFKDFDRCGNKACRMTMDAEGKLIGGPVAYMDYESSDNFIDVIHPIAAHASDKGYVYTTARVNVQNIQAINRNVSLILPNGTEKHLAQFNNVSNVLTYVSNELFVVCPYYDSNETNPTFPCTQYDAFGKVKLQKNFNIESVPKYLVNLPEAGFLSFVMAKKSIEGKDTYTEVYVLKINTDGEIVGKFSMQGLDYTKNWFPWIAPSMSHLWRNEESKQYCATVVADVKSHVNVIVNCFDDTDFVHY